MLKKGNYYTNPAHIIKWNFADPSWHCPSESNDMRAGGKYIARMEAKDGSSGFNFEAIYIKIINSKQCTYEFRGRFVAVPFDDVNGKTEITVSFDLENENPADMQKAGWQVILNNFKIIGASLIQYTQKVVAAWKLLSPSSNQVTFDEFLFADKFFFTFREAFYFKCRLYIH